MGISIGDGDAVNEALGLGLFFLSSLAVTSILCGWIVVFEGVLNDTF